MSDTYTTREQRVKHLLFIEFSCDTASSTPDTLLGKDLGLDSMDLAEVPFLVADEFGFRSKDAPTPRTLADILAWLDEKLGPEGGPGQSLQLTEDQFVDRYNPELTEQGDLYRQRSWHDKEDVEALTQAVHEGRCWTLVEDDYGRACFSWGNRMVNHIYNVITIRPIEFEGMDVYVDLGDPMPDEEPEDEES